MRFWSQLQERLAELQTFLTREMFCKSIIHAYQHCWTNFSPLVFRTEEHFSFLLKCIAVWRFLYYLFSDPFIIMSYGFIMISCAGLLRWNTPHIFYCWGGLIKRPLRSPLMVVDVIFEQPFFLRYAFWRWGGGMFSEYRVRFSWEWLLLSALIIWAVFRYQRAFSVINSR